MFSKKFLSFEYLSLISIILVAMVSNVKAESSFQGNNDLTQFYAIEKTSATEEDKPAQENIEGEELEQYELVIKGMTCADCEVKVKEALLKCTGVKNAQVSYKEGIAVIEASADIDADEIVDAVKKAGFTVVEEE